VPIKVSSDSKAATLLTLATNTGEERMLDGEMLHLEKSYLNNKIAPSLPAGAPRDSARRKGKNLGQRSVLKEDSFAYQAERRSHGKRETEEAGKEETREEEPAATPPRHDGY